MAAGDLTTLDNVKGWLGLTDPSQTSDDVLLSRLITAASQFIKGICNRDFLQQDYVEVRDGTGANRMLFRNYPASAVASLVINGQSIPSGSPQAPGFYFTPTMLILNGFSFQRGFGNVSISYTAGMNTVPADLEQACIELVGVKYRQKDHIDKVSEAGMAGQSTSFSQADMPAPVRAVLNTYKRVVPL